MKLPEFGFVQPRSLQEACSVLSEHRMNAALLAGGTALIVALRYRLSKPAVLIGLKGLSELDYVKENESGGISIGSMVTLEKLEKSSWLSVEVPGLIEAIRAAAVPPIRHKATVGGNLSLDTRCIYYNQSEFWRSGLEPCFKRGGTVCHAVGNGRHCQAVYQGDLGPILMALGAEVKVASTSAQRVIPVNEFFTGRGERPHSLAPGEILVEVRVPASSRRVRSCYEKLRVREGMDFPLAGVAVMAEMEGSGRIVKAKVVVGAVGPSPREISAAAKLLDGLKPDQDLLRSISREAMDSVQPVANLAMDPAYRRKIVGVFVNRALRTVLGMGGLHPSEIFAE
jgi:4-hydroxybenzoyl-CoA reductase subunit beta